LSFTGGLWGVLGRKKKKGEMKVTKRNWEKKNNEKSTDFKLVLFETQITSDLVVENIFM
jgi:hypothetical protein